MNALLYVFFFASGFAALVYEVAWVRILSVDFGNTVYAVSMVFAAFMAGLALGGYCFGRWIDRGPKPLAVYAALELLLALYAILFVAAMPYRHEFNVSLLQLSFLHVGLVRFLLAMLILLPPTILMGGTLPVLAKAVVESPQRIGLRISVLYGLNTLGAVAGCLAEAYVLIPQMGVKHSILLAALVNAIIGIGAALLARRERSAPLEAQPKTIDDERIVHSDGHAPFTPERARLLYWVAFLSGFVTLAAEVLWTRMYVNFLTGNVLVVATLLGGFLTGIGAGSLILARYLDRLTRLNVVMMGVLIVNSLWLVASVIGQTAMGRAFGAIHESQSEWPQAKVAYACLALLFVATAIPAVSFGTVLPLVLRWGSGTLASLGESVGRIYAFNTVGAILGSLAAGFVMIRSLGVNASLLLLALLCAATAFVLVRELQLRLVAGAAVLVCLSLLLSPTVREPLYWYNGGFTVVGQVPKDEVLFLEEGVEATVGVSKLDDFLSLTVNGLVVAESTQHDLWDLLLKAHLPMLLHAEPRDVALVGLGAGVSLAAVECYDVDHIDCIEISSSVVKAHRYFESVNNRCWEDPRLNLEIEDGRQFLQTTDRRYDVISVDPVDPPVCNLYTQDFFQLCHDRLRRGGLMVQWVPLFRLAPEHIRVILKSFHRVFEDTTVWYDGTSILLIGSRDIPLKIDVQQMIERAESGPVADSLAMIGRPSAWLLLSTYVTTIRAGDSLIGPDVPDNTDDLPSLEYGLLLADDTSSDSLASNLEILMEKLEPIESRIIPNEANEEVLARIRGGQRLMRELLDIRIRAFRGETEEAANRLHSVAKRFYLEESDVTLLSPFWRI